MGNHRRRRNKGKSNAKNRDQEMYEQMGGEGECYVATNVHHRRSKHTGGSNNPSNLSTVPIRAHNEYNRLFRDGHCHPREMAQILTDKWIDPEWEMIARRKGTTDCGTVVQAEKHDCTKCENYQLRQLVNPMLKTMAQEALSKAF